ncbi:O-linked N-acetylglucosamine transferase, SPINDLY family protein [Pseudanabaena sp. Chao 1811]|uniref:O-linked N-acetylglucosamine transferase, SPINDLY family protein n=1 Tax=Pseudanabaena sp. Chao 1811 TaxID=2963092 RepID=UPI0022F3BAA1|nr:tetratricopeptide repeat protein [Pseudanabaena sp. Chao 1811]
MNKASIYLESDNFTKLQQRAFEFFKQSEYDKAVELYEQLISLNSNNKDSYWYLGLSQLLQGKEESAQTTWMLAIDNVEVDQIEQCTDDLGQILEEEAQRKECLNADQDALTIRYHLIDIDPYSLRNLIAIVLISIKVKTFTSEELINLGVFDLINSEEFIPLNEDILLEIIEKLLLFNIHDKTTTQFLESICLSHSQYKKSIINKFLSLSNKIANGNNRDIDLAIKILEIGLLIFSESVEMLIYLSELYVYIQKYEKSIETGQKLYDQSSGGKPIDKVMACHWLISSLIVNCNYWEKVTGIYKEFKIHCENLIKEPPENLSFREAAFYLLVTGWYSPYFDDIPQEKHILRGKIHQLSYSRILATEKERIDNYKKCHFLRKKINFPNRPLKIGYLSSSLKTHSVGYLSRWLLKYHDRNQFELYSYLVGYRSSDPLQLWIEKQFHKSCTEISEDPLSLADQINEDGIDILVDLDSMTSAFCSSVLAFKPAPIQITWLGWDAAGQSTIDYFIADPYVLPESAQTYYTEKIWRLPNTYVAVDGFEVATPTLRRNLLNIPNDAVIYLSAQSAMKRHPDCTRIQMKIVKLVPNSYLLIKSVLGNQESLKEFFYQIADEEGVSTEQLRFLPFTSSAEEHRANLGIADVVLDTYPYNGATHTMETLWMGIPIVTRVGEQFAARNSYTMMVNAGISQGIAWTDDEYVEWGVKLGTDIDLRKQVAWKLKQGRETEPLWDSRQFTRDMETAYKQMWEKYLESDDHDIEVDPERDRALFIAEAEFQNSQGIKLAQQGKLDAAIELFQIAISLDSDLADAYYNLGIAQSERGDIDQALLNFQTTVTLNPNHANGLYNLGLTLVKLGKPEQAIAYYSQSLAILPDDTQTHHALGNAFFVQGMWHKAIECYQSALNIDPNFVDVICSMGAALSEQGKFEEAISSLQFALELDPNNAEAYCNLGYIFSKTKQLTEAVNFYAKALQLKPDLGHAYWNFNNDILSNREHPLHHNYQLRRQLSDQFVESCGKTEKVRASVNFITNYAHSGLSDIAKPMLLELENYVFKYCDRLTNIEIEVLYNNFLFMVSSIRDDLEHNTKLYKLVSELYVERIIKSEVDLDCKMEQPHTNKQIRELTASSKLRIGFLSSHFARHPVGWCSFDVIRELSKITPHIYLYDTAEVKSDDLTKMFEQVAEKYYWQEDKRLNGIENSFDYRLERVIADVANDQLDVLIDLDSLTISFNTHILHRHLAPVCVSWLGFDAPFISADNYCLCDWYTHPSTSDQNYLEKLIRLPNAHMAIAGFECIPIDRNQQRTNLGISPEQIAYLFAAPGRKFNRDTARACIQILQQVPNSVLLHKGMGDLEVIQSIYREICDENNVDFQRIRFLPSYKTEEEHRSSYLIADIYLDSYPYNGGSHNLEALWFNLPVVTRCGEQSFARMGYSFLQSVSINEGVTYSWEEYVSEGVKLGLDSSLRNSIKEKLILSKHHETLAPLWNPKKLASDMYNLLQSIVVKRNN